jgi:isopentenyl phosphate kinase
MERKEKKPLVILKIGGSVFTDRTRSQCFRHDIFSSLLRSIKERTESCRIVLVLGGGSFGHNAVQEDVYSAKTERAWHSLSLAHFQIMLEGDRHFRAHKLPYYPVSVSSLATNGHGDQRYIKAHLSEIFASGMMPVLTGGIQFNAGRPPRVCGSDEVVSFYAELLAADRCVFVTDVNGVQRAGAVGGEIYDTIDESNLDEVRTSLSHAKRNDTTGGMFGKLDASIAVSKCGIPVVICGAEAFVSRDIEDLFKPGSFCTKIML